jgi:hypothetical protein
MQALHAFHQKMSWRVAEQHYKEPSHINKSGNTGPHLDRDFSQSKKIGARISAFKIVDMGAVCCLTSAKIYSDFFPPLIAIAFPKVVP